MAPIKSGFRDILPDDPNQVLKGDGSWGESGGSSPGTPGPAGADGHSPVVAFGIDADADRVTIDGTAAGPHLTGPAGAASTVPGPPGADSTVPGPPGEDSTVPGPKGDKGDAGDPASVSAAWPVGSVFISVISTSPATLLGFGTWAAFGAGRVLVGLDSGDANFDAVEETGGAKTSTPSAHSGAAVADHAALTHAGTAVGNHAAAATGAASAGATQRGTTTSTCTIGTHTHNTPVLTHAVTQPDQHAAQSHSVTQPSAHAALSVVQPYIVVYMWKRTA